MANAAPGAKTCPVATLDQRKSARAVGPGLSAAARPIEGYAEVRRALRDSGSVQAGFKADIVAHYGTATRPPILYLSGEAHHRQRAATARFFAPRAVSEIHLPVIEATAERLVAAFVAEGAGRLDIMALDLAVTVAAQIVGLTDSNKRGMIRRLDAFFSTGLATRTDPISTFIAFVQGRIRMLRFYLRDVRPAIRARRNGPREDVISHLIAEGYSDRDILVECFTYGAAGMVTTREFVTMAGWHLLEDDALRARFLATDRDGRLALLEEILRLEPVVGTLYRRPSGGGETLALDLRSANVDAAAVGACPYMIDPDRARAERVAGAGLSFGDGEHRCPGAVVALHEAEIFLDRLLRVPGLALAKAPTVGWNPLITGYELRDCELVVEMTG